MAMEHTILMLVTTVMSILFNKLMLRGVC